MTHGMDVVSILTSHSRDILTSRSRLKQNPQRLGLRVHLQSRLGAIRLNLGTLHLFSGLGPLRLVETFFSVLFTLLFTYSP